MRQHIIFTKVSEKLHKIEKIGSATGYLPKHIANLSIYSTVITEKLHVFWSVAISRLPEEAAVSSNSHHKFSRKSVISFILCDDDAAVTQFSSVALLPHYRVLLSVNRETFMGVIHSVLSETSKMLYFVHSKYFWNLTNHCGVDNEETGTEGDLLLESTWSTPCLIIGRKRLQTQKNSALTTVKIHTNTV